MLSRPAPPVQQPPPAKRSRLNSALAADSQTAVVPRLVRIQTAATYANGAQDFYAAREVCMLSSNGGQAHGLPHHAVAGSVDSRPALVCRHRSWAETAACQSVAAAAATLAEAAADPSCSGLTTATRWTWTLTWMPT